MPELGMVWPRALKLQHAQVKLQHAQVRSVEEESGNCSSARGNGPRKESGRMQEGEEINRKYPIGRRNAQADLSSACSSAS